MYPNSGGGGGGMHPGQGGMYQNQGGGQGPEQLVGGQYGQQQIPNPWMKFGDMMAPKFAYKTFMFVMIMAQIGYFIVSLFVGQFEFDGAFVLNNPLAGPSGTTLSYLGGKNLFLIQQGQVHRFITPVFLHGGLLHLSVNLYFQFALGFRMEEDWGWKRTAAIYFFTAWGATLMSCIGSPNSISVGASGALFGLIGAEIANLIWNFRDIPQVGMRACNIFMLLIINFIIGLSLPGIDNFAHLGGLITGIFGGLGFLVPFISDERKLRMKKWRIGMAGIAAAYLVGMTVGTFFR